MTPNAIQIERKTAAFYAVLLALMVLDMILLFWIFNPFSRLGSAEPQRRPTQDTTMVDDSDKPSPFELTSHKAALNRPPAKQHPAKLRAASYVVKPAR